MQLLSRLRVVAGLAAVAVVLSGGAPAPAQGKKGGNTKNVTFRSFDGVELSGTLYPNPGGKRDATVLLLHNFDLKKGGSSQQEGWTRLATALQAEGYVVLTFDFRGFGDSKAVESTFWNQKHNQFVKRRGVKPPANIDHKDFLPNYLPYLVNDIAAAKAYLDKLNDNSGCNTSSLFVIGAGDGATLGAMWMANETRRRRDKNQNPLLAVGAPDLGDPESNDLAAGVWLSISPSLGTRTAPLSRWVVEAGKGRKVPMAFIYGKGDAKGDNTATNLLKAIKPTGGKSKEFPNTGTKAIADTKLSGEKLLDSDLETQKWVINYLNGVMDTRGAKIRTDRQVDRHAYWYADPKTGRALRMNKKAGEDVPSVDVTQLLSSF